MIYINVTKDLARVHGSAAESMLFYCFWQTALWPGWVDYKEFGQKNDALSYQLNTVRQLLNEGQEILLFNKGKLFTDAFLSAKDKCEKLNIKIEFNLIEG